MEIDSPLRTSHIEVLDGTFFIKRHIVTASEEIVSQSARLQDYAFGGGVHAKPSLRLLPSDHLRGHRPINEGLIINPAKLEEVDIPPSIFSLLMGDFSLKWNPLLAHIERGITYYIPKMIIVEILCLPSFLFARHLLNLAGINAWCVRNFNAGELTLKFIGTTPTTKRDINWSAFWILRDNVDELLYPLLQSIINHTPHMAPMVNERIRLQIYGHVHGSEVFVFGFNRQMSLPLPVHVEKVTAVQCGGAYNRSIRLHANRTY